MPHAQQPELVANQVGACGKLQLRFTHGTRTKLRIVTQTPPLRVIRAFTHQDEVALVHLHNVSGGVLGGDQFEIALQLDAHAHAMLTTTGANRIYRHRATYATATQTLRAELAAGSVLEYIPDATIPYAGSRYQQHTTITLQPAAKLFWSDILAPGREASDERFEFALFGNDLTIETGNRPILRERWQLAPSIHPINSLAYLGAWTHSATFIACSAGIQPAQLHRLETALTDIALRLNDDTHLWGVSRLIQDGVIVRGLSQIGRDLPNQIAQFHSAARHALLGTPLVLPRKIY